MDPPILGRHEKWEESEPQEARVQQELSRRGPTRKVLGYGGGCPLYPPGPRGGDI